MKDKLSVLIMGKAKSIDTKLPCDFTLRITNNKCEYDKLLFNSSDLESISFNPDANIELTYSQNYVYNLDNWISKIEIINNNFTGVNQLLIDIVYVKISDGQWVEIYKKNKSKENEFYSHLLSIINEHSVSSKEDGIEIEDLQATLAKLNNELDSQNNTI